MDDEYITVTEAARRYGHIRQWWHDRIRGGDLQPYTIPGRDKRGTYLRVGDIEQYMRPRPKPGDGDKSTGQE